MKQRGRHRRRRQGRALRAVLAGAGLALTAAATLISASQATVTDDPGALRPLTSAAELGGLRLTEQPVPARSLDRLAAAMGRPVDAGAVLGDPDRTLRDADDCTGTERRALPVEPSATRAYCWDTKDTEDAEGTENADAREWRPQSVATSGDTDGGSRWGAHQVILSGWTHRGDDADSRRMARVAFVDADDPARLTYTWALLAVPVDGGRDYRALASRVSGMVRYQDKLLVTASGDGQQALYVYDLRRIQRATVTEDAVGKVPGGWSAHGYRWVLPAVASYRPAEGTCGRTAGAGGTADTSRASRASGGDGVAPACPSSLSLDSSSAPDSLVAGETTRTDGDRRTRLWRYSFSADPARSGLLAADSTGTVRAQEAYETDAPGVRGVLSHRTGPAGHTDWYLGRTAGKRGGHGTLWRQDTQGAEATECGTSDDTHRCWGDGVGSLSYAPATGELWSVSGRTLFAVPLSALEHELH
ncbi:hypothetical protein ACWDQO_34835 [Streptomyces sp. NPDC003703]|uniref:hypothetical protein n=1 Tax=Streptomyces sp. NPDC003283 TaxID=3364681 RepID=UPI00367ECDF1